MVLANSSPAKTRGFAFKLEQLELRDVPSTAAGGDHPHRLAVGAGAGQTATVNVYDARTNALLTTITPFGLGYTAGVRVATGDLTGDGIDDVAVAGGGVVKVFDGATFAEIKGFAVRGEFVAVGDVTGDGRADLAVGSAAGERGVVTVYRGQDVGTIPPVGAAEIVAFGTAYTAGVRVALGDVNGDGRADVVVGSGAGVTAQVKVFTTRASAAGELSFTGKSLTLPRTPDTDGVFVSTGDFDGDGKADVAVGRMMNGRARASVYRGGDFRTRLFDASGFNGSAAGGVPVSLRDLDGDGKAELVVGGGDGTSQVRVFGNRGGLVRSFLSSPPNYRGGVFVG